MKNIKIELKGITSRETIDFLLLLSIEEMLKQSIAKKGSDHNIDTTYVISCIFLSFNFLESYINSVYKEIIEGENFLHLCLCKEFTDSPCVKRFLKNGIDKNMSTLVKYQELLKIHGKATFNENKDGKLKHEIENLRKVRNKLIHFEASYHSSGKSKKPEYDAIVKLLKGKFKTLNNKNWWLNYLRYPCACWAVNTTIEFLFEFHNKLLCKNEIPFESYNEKINDIKKIVDMEDWKSR